MAERIYVRHWLFYWVAYSTVDLLTTVRSFSRQGAIDKAARIAPRTYKWESVGEEG